MSNLKTNNTYPALLTGLVLIGVSPILIKLADAPGIITSFYRMAFGCLTLAPIFIFSLIRNKTKIPLKGLIFASLAGVALGTDMSLWATGIVESNATLTTLVANLAPIWVGLGTLFFFKEKQGVGFWLGVFLAILGVALLIGKDFNQSSPNIRGILLSILAGVFYALYQMLTQPGRKYLNTLYFLFISTLSTAITCFIYALIFQENFTGYSNETWYYWIAMGVGIQVGGWFLINYSQGYLPASVISPTLLLQPIVTAILAIFILSERFTIWHVVGGVVIISGIYVVHFTRKKT